MPSKSKAQQRIMGMALAAKRGKGHFSDRIHEIAHSMSEKQLRDFAKTKSKNLPEKKGEDWSFIKSVLYFKKQAEELKGGKGDKLKDSYFNKKELAKGVEHEKEHTKNLALAKEIAKDHLSERKDYYTALDKANID